MSNLISLPATDRVASRACRSNWRNRQCAQNCNWTVPWQWSTRERMLLYINKQATVGCPGL